MRNIDLCICLGVLAAGGIFLISKEPPQEEDHHHHDEGIVEMSEEKASNYGILTEKASPGRLTKTISARGKLVLHPDRLAHVLPKVSGVIKEARKNLGDFVKEGDVLALLESREMAETKAEYLAAFEKKKLASSLFEREERLYEKKISSENDYLSSKSSLEEAKINLELALQKLNALGLDNEEVLEIAGEKGNFRLYAIRAPIDGVVIARHATQGEFVEESTTLFEIADLDQVFVEMGVYPKDIAQVKNGQPVQVSLPDQKEKTEAKIIFMSPVIEEETITAKAIAELDNPDHTFRPGTFVKAEIVVDSFACPLTISKEAVQTLEGKSVVFKRDQDHFVPCEISVGRCDANCVEILSGLSAGDEYAKSNTFLLKADLGKESMEHED